ncbi:MAG: TA system VapC family ribonuclease toxin [Pyrinomonadaceae bacterium]
MRALLDVNVIIALHDPSHTHGELAHEWWSENSSKGWASCPISEIGFIRISSGPRYSPETRFTPGDCIEMLSAFIERNDHEFWPDSVSFSHKETFSGDLIATPRQLTDIYLLALAVKNGGRLVTFDRRITIASVIGAAPQHLCILS